MKKCSFCKNLATKENSQGIPVCASCSRKKSKASSPDCPECGKPMALRKSKFGTFWGCMAYPECVGTKKV